MLNATLGQIHLLLRRQSSPHSEVEIEERKVFWEHLKGTFGVPKISFITCIALDYTVSWWHNVPMPHGMTLASMDNA